MREHVRGETGGRFRGGKPRRASGETSLAVRALLGRSVRAFAHKAGRVKRTWMKRHGKRTKRSRGHLFEEGRDPTYLEYIRSFPCVICLKHGLNQKSRTQACHVKSRGAGGIDRGNTYPGCGEHHDEQGMKGFRHMEKKYGMNLANVALQLGLRYEAAA